MCNVCVSEVTASLSLDGEIARERMTAGCIPRRSSARRAVVSVECRRMRVPCLSKQGRHSAQT